MNVELVKRYTFEAAHRTGRDGLHRLHGHSYVAEIVVAGPVDDAFGWLVDYGEITAAFNPIYRQLDHYLLDEVSELDNVTCSGVAAWIEARLRPRLTTLKEVRVCIVGPSAFKPEPVEGRVRFGFEAAHFLPRLPDDHKCKRMHGHSFAVEVGVRDGSPEPAELREVYDALDHRCLNEVAGLENPTSEHVCRWIWRALVARGVDVSVVSVAETCTARCDYYGT